MSSDDLIDNYTWVNFKFKSIRIVDNVVTSHVSTIKAELLMSEETTDVDVNVVFEKIHFWFDSILPHSIMFCRENTSALNMLFDENGLPRTENFPMVLPEEPTDDFLAVVLHSKMNALAGATMAFGMIEIQSDTREKLTCTYTGYGEMSLPTMYEWVGERAFHEKPWWARNDGSTLDVIPGEDADLTKAPNIGIDLSFIESKFRRDVADQAIIIRPQFKPEIISGGKDEPPKS